MKIGIDASRNRSGGAIRHLKELIYNLDSMTSEFDEIHLWAYEGLLQKLDNRPWLKKHSPLPINQGLVKQLFWQRFLLNSEFRKYNCDILLNADAGSVSTVSPCVTMSRDMLSYEPGEMERYKYTRAWLRLHALKFVQNRSLKRSDGVIFLTHYASNIIQKSCGNLADFEVIHHGINEKFRSKPRNRFSGKSCKMTYVSNVELYKHQWHVVRACAILKNEGVDLELNLVGHLDGHGKKRLLNEVEGVDPCGDFINLCDFVEPDALPKILQNTDIFIFASSCENMPNTLIEGMAAGTPIACSNRGPMPEVLQDAGVYFDPEDSVSIAQALRMLITDSNLRQTMAKKAYERSQNFSWQKCTSQTLQYIRKIHRLGIGVES